ncbi:MAG TPA: formate dehydrogenase subunit alpha [Acidobacteriaceae bacterium]|nr:formate dehydrogenase subunit alpha [Acidobacteriaceae bacterium]
MAPHPSAPPAAIGSADPPLSPHSFTVKIDGIEVSAQQDELLVDVINRAGRELAQVCYHPQLGPIQTCDTCMVEVNGELVRACGTRVQPGMNAATASPRARAAQREAFDVILGNHLLYCTVCDNNNENCTVHNTTAMLNVEHQEIPYRPKPYEKDMSNPFYRYDPDQCILCGRCVEACQDLQVNETLSINWEDPHPRVLWDGGAQINESSCVSCGHCISVCPCNALMEKSMLGQAGYLTGLPEKALEEMIDVVKGLEPETGYGAILQVSQTEAAMRRARIRKTKTVCTYCGVGCSFDMWTKDRHILKVEPFAGAANGVSTCIKGKFGWDYVDSQDRLNRPLMRDGDTFREASWEEALSFIARRIQEIKAKNGPDALAFIASSKCTNEESYLVQKLARAVVGTNNTDNCSRYCQTPATKGLARTVGYGGDTGTIQEIAKAGLVLIIGSNTAESHPVLATRVKRAHKLHGQRLIVADLRKHEMAARADIFIQPRPGTDLVWLNAIAKYILDHGLAKMDFVRQWVNGFDEYARSLMPFTMQFAERITGVPEDTLTTIAHEIVKADGVCILWAMGVTQHCGGSDTSTAISNLLLLTGNYMRHGAGSYPLRGHNNVQGCSDFGSMPDMFPGYQPVEDDEIRHKFEKAWGVKLDRKRGFDNHEVIDAIHDGKVKMMYVVGEDMLLAESNVNHTAAAFEKLELFVVQDIFFSSTCRYADVILPACPSVEKEGTFTSTERRIQRLYEVLEPIPGSRPDWRIIQDIANALGADWKYKHPSDVMDECAALAPIFAGVTYERLAGYKTLCWPVEPDGTDSPLLFTEKFPFPDGKAKFFPVHWEEPCDQPDTTYDLHLNNGRILEHFHEGNMTYRVPGIKAKTPDTFIEVSPELAAERNLSSGQVVDLISRYGQNRLRVLVTDRVSGKQLYAPLNSAEEPVNRLTGNYADRVTDTPAYKEAAVHMVAHDIHLPNPLPRTNHRFGHPTPQHGVEVERKWRRPDYHMPGNGLPRNGRTQNGLVQIDLSETHK